MSDTMAMTTADQPVWRRLFVRAREVLERVPFSLIQLAMRVSIGFVFFNAGLLKYRSFEFAVKLFAEQYRLPIISPELAATLAMIVELSMPILLFAGLATRFATLPLIGMSLIIVLLVYPGSWNESLLWGSILVTLLTRGPGVFSLDYLIERWLSRKSA